MWWIFSAPHLAIILISWYQKEKNNLGSYNYPYDLNRGLNKQLHYRSKKELWKWNHSCQYLIQIWKSMQCLKVNDKNILSTFSLKYLTFSSFQIWPVPLQVLSETGCFFRASEWSGWPCFNSRTASFPQQKAKSASDQCHRRTLLSWVLRGFYIDLEIVIFLLAMIPLLQHCCSNK